ncbi:hypothetical protein E4P82_05510 [Candidatus Competibacter phosphatis]|uniref:DUF4168 domain-containing protein n=1 Tax=Candidatus Competibacter phosphatis TaxID=221280 RepID=A0ABX1TJ31_9GAMM|nr:hypothetical protein [Candidatus Competibacter phosphatis]NMQ18707.1 hypothetical protein [Candidatus Competibacter phosphatis]
MPSTTLRFSARAHGCVAGLLLLIPLLLGADDYLREIEEEAKRQAPSLVIDPSPPAPGTTAVGDTTTDRLAAGLDQVAFEQALRENLPGTYAFYQQLGPDQRKQVYETYRSDNRFASISEQVARLLSGKH